MICNLFHHRIPKHDHFLSVRCLLPPPPPCWVDISGAWGSCQGFTVRIVDHIFNARSVFQLRGSKRSPNQFP